MRRRFSIAIFQVLFEYSKNIGLELGQVGYQAMASSCREQRDGMNLLMKMKVTDLPVTFVLYFIIHILG